MNFTFINQNMLNDLFYILVSILIFYFIYDHSKVFRQYKKYQNLLITVCLSVPLFLCMKFPIYIAYNCVHDFRQIPFLIGALYGGWPVGLILLAELLIIRFALYGFNFITIVVYMTMFIIAAYYSKKFIQLNRKNKLIMSMLVTLFLALLTTYLAVIIADFNVTKTYIIDFIVVPPIAMIFVVFVIEMLNDAMTIRSKLIKVEKMEIVSQLAASISHEIRNPLTVVKGFAQLLKASDLPKESREQYINHVLEELSRAEVIIDDYLTFAKPAPQKIDQIFIDQELQKVIDMLIPLANMNSVKIHTELTTDCVNGNKQQFHQCFINLIKNSIEAMPTGGELNIAASNNKDKVIISIQDSGVGMTRQQISRFGEPYFTTKEKGTGLGTMVAVKIIETMNGTLSIKSGVNKGTSITITFLKTEKEMKTNRIKKEKRGILSL